MVVWDLHTRKPKKVIDVPGAPLEIRCAWGANNNYCFPTTALTSKIWLITALEEAIKAIPIRPKMIFDISPENPFAKNIAVAAVSTKR